MVWVTLAPLPASTAPSEPLPAAVPQPAAPTRSATPVASGQGPKQAVTRSGRPIAVEPAAPDGSVEGLTAALPVAPAPQAPVIQKVPESPVASAAPAIRSAQVACANYREVMSSIVYPRDALQSGTEGEVVIEFTVGANGQIKDAVIKSSSNRMFNRSSMAVVSQMEVVVQKDPPDQGADLQVPCSLFGIQRGKGMVGVLQR